MGIILLLSNELKQRYVIRELSKKYNIVGAVIEDKYTFEYRIKNFFKQIEKSPLRLIISLYKKLKLRKYERRDWKIIESYFLDNGKPIEFDKTIPVKIVGNINEEESIEFIKKLKSELIVVFGTSLVRKEIMQVPKKTIINVHTGLSPYYRGGQSAFWCLYNNEPEYIGVTIHYIDEGIDSGDIILQGRPEIEEGDSLASIECKLALLSIDLLKETIGRIQEKTANRIKQWEKGRLYLSRDFTLDKRLELEKRLEDGLIKRHLDRKDNGKLEFIK